MTPKIKKILIFVGIFIAIIAIYFIFFSSPATKPTVVSKTTGSAVKKTNTPVVDNTVGKEFLAQLLSVQTIKLDDSIFSTTAFNSLKDTTDTTLTLSSPNDEGRTNPFSPIGSDPSVSNASSTQILPPMNSSFNGVGGINLGQTTN